MTNRGTRNRTVGATLAASIAVVALAFASGCELVVKLDVALGETDAGPPTCAICLDGSLEPDGNIVFGPQPGDAESDAAHVVDGGSDAASASNSGSGGAEPDAGP